MDYDTVFQVGSHYFAREFAKDGAQVQWLNQPGHLFKRKTNYTVNDQLNIYYPKGSLPYCRYPLLNSKLWAKYYWRSVPGSISREIRQSEHDVLWMTNVKMFYSTDKLKYRYLIHRMADNFSGFKGAYRNMLYMQSELVRKSNLVIVTAKNLVAQARNWNRNVLYLPNGVDIERFKQNDHPMPVEYMPIADRTKVVYVGALEEWFDYDLMRYAVRELKETAFIIIGGTNDKIEAIAADYPNLILLGRKDHHAIPAYIKSADVGIMPFLSNKLTNSIHPLKLYEYFAAGIPAVCTRLDEVEQMNSPAFLYDSKEEFVDMIKHASLSSAKPEQYISYAEKNTWKERFQTIKEFIDEGTVNQ